MCRRKQRRLNNTIKRNMCETGDDDDGDCDNDDGDSD